MPDKKLFEEFPAVSAEQWIQQVVKDLKGESFDEKLKYVSADGISIDPFYTAENLTKYNECKPLFSHSDWEVCDRIVVKDEKKANNKALNALNNGASGLVFHVSSTVELDILLNEIQIEYIAVQFVLTEGAIAFSEKLNAYISSKKIDAKKLNMVVNVDPIGMLAKTGESKGDKNEPAAIFSADNSMRTINVNAAVYQNAGASQGYEIACALAHLNEYINVFKDSNIEPSVLANKIQINIAVGPDYFFEIAKLRAYRKVFALLFEEYNIAGEIYMHAETSFRNLTVFDAHNNLLRSTTEAMAASIGGCNSLTVLPFDAAYSESNDFAERMARNIQLILKSESYFDKIADASAGTYFIEELTEQLAEKAWNYFMEMEKDGGLTASLEKGKIQSKIKQFAAMKQEAFDSGKEVLVGTNKFPDTKENKKDKQDSIVWGNEAATGKTIEPLTALRLSAANEQQRLANS